MEPDFVSAIKLYKRRNWTCETESNRELFYKRYGVMARSGFNYEISKS